MSNPDTNFEPQAVHDYFIGITQRPHPSANQPNVTGNENPVRQLVVDEAGKIPGVKVVFYQPEASEPGDRVIVLSRPGAGQYAGQKPVILQAHLDMVYNPANMEFPLTVIPDPSQPDGKWIKAQDKNGTPSTLGADDGIGVATALAILKDETLKDFPMECLFTVQEETDMGGAQNCDLKNLTGETLLNLDAEDLKVIIYGSAGGAETNYTKDLTRFNQPAGYKSFKLSISGLRGGHSGVDINKGRLNAIKALSQILTRLNKRINNLDAVGPISSYELYLADFKRTDIIKANAIPSSVEAIVSIPEERAASFISDFSACCETLKAQYQPVESKFTYHIAETNVNSTPLDNKSTDAVLGILSQVPTGVIAMIPAVPDVVETSSNLYNVELTTDGVMIGSSNRSSNDSALSALNALQTNIGGIFNFSITTGIDSYTSWQPDENSRIKNISYEVYKQAYDPDAVKTTVIHAGLECGTLASRFNSDKHIKLDCVSIGPTIKNPHTGNETLEIESAAGTQTVNQFYQCVGEIIRTLYK